MFAFLWRLPRLSSSCQMTILILALYQGFRTMDSDQSPTAAPVLSEAEDGLNGGPAKALGKSRDSDQSPTAAPVLSEAEDGLNRGPAALGQSRDSDQSPNAGNRALRSRGRSYPAVAVRGLQRGRAPPVCTNPGLGLAIKKKCMFI